MRARLPLLLAMAALLLLAVLTARGGSAVPNGHGVLFGARGTTQSGPDPGRRAPPITGPLGVVLGTATGVAVVAVLVLFLGVVVMAGMALASIRWHRRERLVTGPGVLTDEPDDGAPPAGSATAMARGARAAVTLLRQRIGAPPADAVQQAWLVLESAAAESGARRRPEQTPTEFTTALLAGHAVDPAAVTTLRGLYQRARFGAPASITDADAAAAIDALERIAGDLDTTGATR